MMREEDKVDNSDILSKLISIADDGDAYYNAYNKHYEILRNDNSEDSI